MLRYLAVVWVCLAGCLAMREDQWVSLMRLQMQEAGVGVKADPLPQLAQSLGLTDLVALVKKADLVNALSGAGPFTLFGPNNDAIAKLSPKIKDMLLSNKTLLQEVLEYHVLGQKVLSTQLSNELLAPTLLSGYSIRINIYDVPGKNKVVTAQGSPVVLVDQMASNGVLHELSRVMLPPYGTIAHYVTIMAPEFSTLTTALKAAGLVDTLNGPGNFTVFAPTNAAFAKLPAGVLDGLLKNVTALKEVLLYHVVGVTAYSAGLYDGEVVPTLQGKDVTVSLSSSGVMINSAPVRFADVPVTNGVIHILDAVLIPPKAHYQLMFRRK